jgi:hypothetical protein
MLRSRSFGTGGRNTRSIIWDSGVTTGLVRAAALARSDTLMRLASCD